jgi:hypothetical protein
MLVDILLNQLQHDIGHALAREGTYRFEAAVQRLLNGDRSWLTPFLIR